jgi:hypothetical protein
MAKQRLPGRLVYIYTQLPISWVPGALSLGVKRPWREADYLQLVPRSRVRGSIHPLPHTSSWCSA